MPAGPVIRESGTEGYSPGPPRVTARGQVVGREVPSLRAKAEQLRVGEGLDTIA